MTHRHIFTRPKLVGHRPELDGLRAIAVLSVLFFHADLGVAPGGYVGVDVFFVISGFLISKLIAAEIDNGTFSLLRFYERRIRRLFPALFAMLFAAILVGAVVLLPQDFAYMSRNAFGAASFVSNIAYWTQTGYFEGDAKVRVLLHTWSLAVEEQFYIVFPVFLMAVIGRCPKYLRAIIAVVAALSFGLCVWVTSVDQSSAFYLTPFRIWEFLLGAMLATAPDLRNAHTGLKSWAGIAGLILIFGSILLFDELTVFPGAVVLAPCLGTVLLIWSGKNSPTGALLSSYPLQFLGQISYSVYLWHWPIFVYVNYAVIGKLNLFQNSALAALSIGIGYLSWRYIELPFRKPYTDTSQKSVFAIAVGAIVLVSCSSALIYFNDGIPERFGDNTVKLASYEKSMNPESDMCGKVELQLAFRSKCTIGNVDTATTILWGDSHAGALFGALEQVSKDNGEGIIYGASPQCPPLLDAGTSTECIEGNRRRLDYILAHDEIKTVILGARWSLYLEGRFVSGGEAETNSGAPHLIAPDGNPYPLFSDTARHHFRDGIRNLVQMLMANGKHVILVYPVPETGYNIPQTLAILSRTGQDPAAFTISRDVYVERQWRAIRILEDLGHHKLLTRIYPDRVFCPNTRCMTVSNGSPLYFDSHHLSIPGAMMLERPIKIALARVPTV